MVRWAFTPAICKEAKKAISKTIRRSGIRNRTELSIEQIANWLNPKNIGWLNYYGEFTKSAMGSVMWILDKTLIAWCVRKYKRFKNRPSKAYRFLIGIAENRPLLFVHWKMGFKMRSTIGSGVS